MITTVAVLSNNCPTITILRYKHSEPKLHITHEVTVNEEPDNINKMPFECQLENSGRVLVANYMMGR